MPFMPTAVVTGGAGFLGSHLCEYLLTKGYRVICVDNLESGTLENLEHLRDDGLVFRNHDMTFHLDIDEPVDTVYHLAALASPIDYLRQPLFRRASQRCDPRNPAPPVTQAVAMTRGWYRQIWRAC